MVRIPIDLKKKKEKKKNAMLYLFKIYKQKIHLCKHLILTATSPFRQLKYDGLILHKSSIKLFPKSYIVTLGLVIKIY